ncbi:MAG: adenylate/guanylate cyclase domain-containing protein [Candidatus Omnitrophica bacterium]|nr:adenylate/guanylate cyclase domain-containing protein [Candidatus Omnitrophota bacterium]
MKRGARVLLPSIVLLAVCALRIANPPLLQEFQLKIFDTLQRLHPRPYRQVSVRIVDVDDESLARLGQWPWPRTQIAQLVTRLRELNAAAIVFDIVFAEPDRTAPAQILSLWPATPAVEALRERVQELPDHDALFAQAISAAPVVTGFVLTEGVNTHEPALKAAFAHAGDDPRQFLHPFQAAVVNLPALEAAASGNGSFTILADRDGIIRRVPLAFRLRDRLHPSLVAEAIRVTQGASTYLVKSSGASGQFSLGTRTGVTHLKIGSMTIPSDAQGRLWLYDTGPVAERFLPAWRVLADTADPAKISGHIVFIGTSAAGLKDLRTTPLNPVAAGVEVHAQCAEQILLQEFLLRPDWADGAELIYVLILGIGLIILLPWIGPAWCAALALTAILGACGASWAAFTHLRWLLDPIVPSLAVVLIYLAGSLMIFLQTERERRWVRQAFSRYLSPVLVKRLAENPKLLRLGGELKAMTLLFADIRGFTTIAEQFDAEALTKFMNRFLTPMTQVIQEHFGTIDKYIGDCIMAFWNAPLDDPQHTRHAAQAALAMRAYLVTWNRRLRAEAEAAGRQAITVHIGIGINTGECCVGNLGSDQCFNYSVLGDDVNLASRLEGQSKVYRTDIVIGPATAEAVQDLTVLELDLIRVKGKTKPTRIYGLLGDETLKLSDGFPALEAAHGRMLAAYRARQWDEAKRWLEECLKFDTPKTRLRVFYAVYRERINAYQTNPPGEEWDGVFVAQTK